MIGMMMFWLVLAIAVLGFAVVTRVYPLIISSIGMIVAAVMAWQNMGLVYQISAAVVLLCVGVFFWIQQTRPLPEHPREAGPSRLSGMGALSNFSAFSDESDEVTVDEWDARGGTQVLFRGRSWKARLAKGAQARPGLYKVREVRDGQLILDEVID